MKKIEKKRYIKESWKIIKENWLFILIVIVITFVVTLLPDFIYSRIPQEMSYLRWVVYLAGVVIKAVAMIGVINISLRLVDGKRVTYKSFYSKYKLAINYIAASILTTIPTIIGMILLIVPGVILAIKFQFTRFFIVDKKMGPITAIKASWRITKGVTWRIFLLDVVLGLINLGGALLFGLGLLVTYPLTFLTYSLVYRQLYKGR